MKKINNLPNEVPSVINKFNSYNTISIKFPKNPEKAEKEAL